MSDGTTIQAAFVKAWGEIENPPLDSVNPHFKSRYASLNATIRAVRAACVPNGLKYNQLLARCEDGRYELRSSVDNAGGESIPLSAFPVDVPPNPQSFASNMTYVKRQQAMADWGIVGDEDDDGEAAAPGGQAPAQLVGRCTACGAQYTFASVEQMNSSACPCGGTFEAVR